MATEEKKRSDNEILEVIEEKARAIQSHLLVIMLLVLVIEGLIAVRGVSIDKQLNRLIQLQEIRVRATGPAKGGE